MFLVWFVDNRLENEHLNNVRKEEESRIKGEDKDA